MLTSFFPASPFPTTTKISCCACLTKKQESRERKRKRYSGRDGGGGEGGGTGSANNNNNNSNNNGGPQQRSSVPRSGGNDEGFSTPSPETDSGIPSKRHYCDHSEQQQEQEQQQQLVPNLTPVAPTSAPKSAAPSAPAIRAKGSDGGGLADLVPVFSPMSSPRGSDGGGKGLFDAVAGKFVPKKQHHHFQLQQQQLCFALNANAAAGPDLAFTAFPAATASPRAPAPLLFSVGIESDDDDDGLCSGKRGFDSDEEEVDLDGLLQKADEEEAERARGAREAQAIAVCGAALVTWCTEDSFASKFDAGDDVVAADVAATTAAAAAAPAAAAA